MSPHLIQPPPTDNQPVVFPAVNARGAGAFRRPYAPSGTIHYLRGAEADAARYIPPSELEEMGFTEHDIAVLDQLPMTLRDRVIEQIRADREAGS